MSLPFDFRRRVENTMKNLATHHYDSYLDLNVRDYKLQNAHRSLNKSLNVSGKHLVEQFPALKLG